MLTFSKIDDNLSIYHGSVVIFGSGSAGIRIYNILKSFGIEVVAFCDNNQSKWGSSLLNLPIISVNELENLSKAKDILVQIGSTYEKDIAAQLEELGIKNYITYSEAKNRLIALKYNRIFKSSELKSKYMKAYDYKYLYEKSDLLNYLMRSLDNTLLLCLPTKTGDHSLNLTLDKCGIDYYNMWHRPFLLDDECNSFIDDLGIEKIKIVTAVRDPISQNLSILFQIADDINEFSDLDENWKNGGDIQSLFDLWLKLENYSVSCSRSQSYLYNMSVENYKIIFMIQKFFALFAEHIGNILEYPFDTSRGYSVIKMGRYEIFVYQLEKLNQIEDKLLEWIGIPNAKLLNDNMGDEKWYAKSYQKAKQELKISKEYFEKCFDEPYVKHFYNEHDIELFKNRWKNNIKIDGDL